MKLIIAIIQPDKLDAVRQALIDAEITRITVSRCTGHGRQEDMDLYRGKEVTPNLIPKVRIEIAVNDTFEKITVDTIVKAARHGDGKLGDGKIFVQDLARCVRIRTGEEGSEAI